MKLVLTNKSVAALELPPGVNDAWARDTRLPGYAVRLRRSSDGGKTSKTYYFRKVPIGPAAALPEPKARETATGLYLRTRAGHDVVAEKREQRAAAALQLPCRAMIDRYLTHQKSETRQRSYQEIERHLLKNAKPLHDVP